MTTFSDLVDRTLNQWLVPPDDQPLRFALDADLSDTAVSLSYSEELLPPEQEEILGPGVLLEIGLEQILAGTVDATTNDISGLIRGVNGTSPTAHSSGDLVTISPVFSRKAVFDALGDAVQLLHPRLFKMESAQVTVDSDYNEAPSDLLSPVSFTYLNSDGKPAEATVQWANPFPDSSTGAVVVIQAPEDKTGWLNYRARFARPSAESDTLDSLGLKDSWAQLLVVGAVHRVVTSRDLSAASQEFLTRQMAQQGFQVPSGSRIRDGLVRYYEDLMGGAIADQHAEHETTAVSTFPHGSPWL